MKSVLVVAGLVLGALVVGGLVFGVARANSREREVELQRRERLTRLGRPGAATPTWNSPTRSVGQPAR